MASTVMHYNVFRLPRLHLTKRGRSAVLSAIWVPNFVHAPKLGLILAARLAGLWDKRLQGVQGLLAGIGAVLVRGPAGFVGVRHR